MDFLADSLQFCKEKNTHHVTVVNGTPSVLPLPKSGRSTDPAKPRPRKFQMILWVPDWNLEVRSSKTGSPPPPTPRQGLTKPHTVKYFTATENYSKDGWTHGRNPLAFMKVVSYSRPLPRGSPAIALHGCDFPQYVRPCVNRWWTVDEDFDAWEVPEMWEGGDDEPPQASGLRLSPACSPLAGNGGPEPLGVRWRGGSA